MHDRYTFILPSSSPTSHKHQCPKCKCIWEHGDDQGGSDEAHTCPRPGCGHINFWRYSGPEGVTPLVKDNYTFHLK